MAGSPVAHRFGSAPRSRSSRTTSGRPKNAARWSAVKPSARALDRSAAGVGSVVGVTARSRERGDDAAPVSRSDLDAPASASSSRVRSRLGVADDRGLEEVEIGSGREDPLDDRPLTVVGGDGQRRQAGGVARPGRRGSAARIRSTVARSPARIASNRRCRRSSPAIRATDHRSGRRRLPASDRRFAASWIAAATADIAAKAPVSTDIELTASEALCQDGGRRVPYRATVPPGVPSTGRTSHPVEPGRRARPPVRSIGVIMTTEPAAGPVPALKRDRQLEMYRRALKTLPGGTELQLPGLGRRHDLRRPGQGRDASGTSTATSSSTSGWATGR